MSKSNERLRHWVHGHLALASVLLALGAWLAFWFEIA
jgi:hypothetical protein